MKKPAILLIILSIFFTPAFAQELPASLHISVSDILSSNPLAGATLSVRQRLIETDPDGENHLLPIAHGQVVAESFSDASGHLALEIELAEPALFSIEISAPGYEGLIESMLPINPGERKSLFIRLVPRNLTPEEAEEVARIHENLREEPSQQQTTERLLPDEHLRALGVTVPDEVRVQDLNGFTGQMNFDEFIAGVVTREMNDGFPREALRAQAVASRSFALHRLRALGYANGGQAYSSSLGTLSRAAALYTTKQVLLYNGSVIQAFFSARCNGDFTLNSEDGPTLSRCFRGGLTSTVVPYCRSRPCSGHVNCSATSEQCCAVTIDGKTNHIYGHGVGLCQRGAQQFASRDGLSYERILTNYYTGVALQKPEPVVLPAVETLALAPADISSTSAIIRGRVTSDGGSAIIDRRFDWGTSTPLSQYVLGGITVSGNAFAATLAGLSPQTTYYYRAWARNGSSQSTNNLPAGWSIGNILSFTTPPTNSLTLRVLLVNQESGGPAISLEVRSQIPDTPFAIEATPALLNPSWTPIPQQPPFRTDANGITQIQVPPQNFQFQFYRALILEAATIQP